MAISNTATSVKSEIIVHNAQELNAALRYATGGETILLASGNYDLLKLTSRTFNSEVTIKSLDADHPAKFSGVNFNRVQNVTLDSVDVTFATNQTGSLYARALTIQNSNGIEVRNSNIHGSVDGNFTNDGVGIGVVKSQNVELIGNTFHDLHRGAVLDDVVNSKVNGNKLYDIRSDGLDFTEMKNVVIDGNYFGQFRPAETNAVDHPGAIQFWTNGAEKTSENIVISNNVSMQSAFDGFPVGGIFFRDEKGNLPYSNVLIENNVIYTRDADSITLGHVLGGVVRNNTVLSVPNSEYTASIFVGDRSSGITVENNLTNGLIYKVPGVVSTNNELVQWQDPNKPGYYGDKLVNGLDAKDLADLLPLPGAIDPSIGSALISQLASKPDAYITSNINPGTINSMTAIFGVASFETQARLAKAGIAPDATYEWSFGDGTRATGATASHTYAHGGIFDVLLTIRSGDQVDVLRKSVFIYNPVVIDMKFDGNLHNGSDLPVAASWNGLANFDPGKTGQAAEFDGGKTNTAIAVDGVDMLSGMKQMTMSFDFKADALTAGRMVWLHGSFGVEINAGKLSVMTVTDDGVMQWTKAGDKSMVDGKWHEFTMRYDGEKGELDLFVDGVLAGRTAGHLGALAEVHKGLDLMIGGAFGRNFDGKIDNLKIVHGVDEAPDRALVSDAGGVTVRGSAVADLLLNEKGNDVFRGGAGADFFRFDGVTVGNGDTDRITDVDFKAGDRIVFAGFEANTFKQIAGGNVLQITDSGRGVQIDSFADFKELVQASDGAITATRVNGADLQIDFHHDAATVQHLVIANGWASY